MNHPKLNPLKYAIGGAAMVGGMGTSAHAQYVLNYPLATVSTPDTLYFDVDDGTTSTSDSSLEFFVETNTISLNPKVGANTFLTEGFTQPLNVGDTVDGSSSFTLGGLGTNKLSNGTNYIGYYIYEPLRLTPDYGYFVIEQTEVPPQGPLGSPVYTDTLVETVFNPTRGQGVKIMATVAPEPGTSSLLLASAAGAAGLAAWRRRAAVQAL